MPEGSFMMGAIPGESRNPWDMFAPLDGSASMRRRGPDEVKIIANEHPRHRVEMDIPFAIARNETTHAEWMACVAEGGCAHVPDHRTWRPSGRHVMGPTHPVVDVSCLDALDYVAWLNAKIGAEVYRLPTEAEWEYAARAGTETRYAQGDDLTSEQATFSGRTTERMLGKPLPHLREFDTPVPVDELDAANAWGVRHMSGNVTEITLSCWSDEHLGLATSSAYLAHALSNGPCRRVGKGGSYFNDVDSLRPARRTRPKEDYRNDYQGFRVVRTLDREE